MSKLHLS